MNKTHPDNELTRFTLRLQKKLLADIEAAADYNGRSVNAEMVARLSAASVNDQFAKVFRELAEIKAADRELLDALLTHRP